jgi:hypothetical protein
MHAADSKQNTTDIIEWTGGNMLLYIPSVIVDTLPDQSIHHCSKVHKHYQLTRNIKIRSQYYILSISLIS